MLERLALVTWTNPESRWGREAHLDDKNRVVYSVGAPWEHPSMSYLDGNAVIVHPAIGCRMVKSKTDRPTVPSDILTLRDMWQVYVTASAANDCERRDRTADKYALDARWDECDLCCEDVLSNQRPVYKCMLCLLSCHPSRGQRLAMTFDDEIMDCASCAAEELPTELQVPLPTGS